jgi:hypothetical protein
MVGGLHTDTRTHYDASGDGIGLAEVSRCAGQSRRGNIVDPTLIDIVRAASAGA